MNIIKKVIVVVMGMVVIGILATNINIINQPKTVYKTVTFELLENDELGYNVFGKINDYAVYDNTLSATNLISISINDTDLIDNPDVYNPNELVIFIRDNETDIPTVFIYNDNTYEIDDGFNVGDIISITFEVEQQTPLVVKTLLALAPLILTAAVIMFTYKGFGNKE